MQVFVYFGNTGASVAVTGTATASINEADVVAGGKTLILTLTGDTWVASGATFNAQRQNIIDGIDSGQAEATGWDAVVKALQGVAGVVRTSDTVVTITLDAQATYNITATETITVTVPATALTGGAAIVASPTFTVAVSGFFGGLIYFKADSCEAQVFKNVASQKITLFAFDSATGLPKTGDAANITAYVSKDDGAVTVLGDTSATEADATNAKGDYLFDLTQAETNADKLRFSAKSTTSGIVIVPVTVYTIPASWTIPRVTLTDTLTTYTGNTPQTADHTANIAAILVDTGTTLQGELDGIQADTEDIQSRLPAALTGDGNIKADTLKIEGADPSDTIRDSVVDDATRIDASQLNTHSAITAATNASAVWEALLADHLTPGTFGYTLTVAATNITSALADTNELQTDWADGGRLDVILDARASQTSVDNLPTNAELATALGTADDAVLTAIGDLPTNAELATALGTADDAVLAAIAALTTPPTVVAIANEVQTRTIAAVTVVNGLADGIITDAKISLPAEAAGQPTGILGMVRRLWERMAGGSRVVKNATTVKTYAQDNTTVLLTQSYTSTSSTDDIAKGA